MRPRSVSQRPDSGGYARRLTWIALPVLMIILIGTAGFILIEGWGFLDSLYMAVITLTTVGFSEIHPLTAAGRVFVIGYMVLGVGVFIYGAAQLGEMILRGQLLEFLGSKRMDTALKSLNGHLIICGFGRMGMKLCAQLSRESIPFVVIDREADACAVLESEGYYYVQGDATDDRVLQAAGVERARGLAAVLSSDADNLYVVLSARLLQPDLQILARTSEEKNREKLKRAGANRVVNIYEAGAHKMAQLMSHANLEDFIEIFSRRGSELDVAQFTVRKEAEYCGKSLAESGLRQRNVMVVCILKPGGDILSPPPSSARLDAGDSVIVLGKPADLTPLVSSPA